MQAGIGSVIIAGIEFVYLVFTISAARKSKVNRLVIATIFLLFGYQFLEALICFFGLGGKAAAYLALSDISLLPPLGLYTVLVYSNRIKQYHKLLFLPALFFILYYPFALGEIETARCTVLYAVYNYPLGFLYGFVYYLPIAAALILLTIEYIKELKTGVSGNTIYLLLGYGLTFIPGILLALTIPEYMLAPESLLCKLALVLASFAAVFVINNKEE